jgi:hypothetical protein
LELHRELYRYGLRKNAVIAPGDTIVAADWIPAKTREKPGLNN